VRLLLVAATDGELASIVSAFAPSTAVATTGPRCRAFTHLGHDVHVLTTGVGMVATAAHAARTLAGGRYDLALNLGVCGSFDRTLPPGQVVHVTSEALPELGAEDGDAFLSLADLGLLPPNEFPYVDGLLRNADPPVYPPLAALPAVAGITVNTVHGGDASIAWTMARVHAQVESMEGAAFFYACLTAGVPFAQVRAGSNVVERRNRAAWKLPEAIAALTRTTLEILEHA